MIYLVVLLMVTQVLTIALVMLLNARLTTHGKQVKTSVEYCDEQTRNVSLSNIKNAECLLGQAKLLKNLLDLIAPAPAAKRVSSS